MRGQAFCRATLMAVALAAGSPALGDVLEISGNPLVVRADELGTIGVLRWEGGALVPQYYAVFAKGSALFLDGTNPAARWGSGTATFALWDDAVTGRFTAVGHTQPDPWTIRTTLAAGTSGVQVVQTLRYTNGAVFYTLTWEITNAGPIAATNLHFVHGGDVALSGEDFAHGFWDAAANMVYVRTTNPAHGLMGLYGDPSTPAARYMAGHFQLVRDASKAAALDHTVNPGEHDAAYALQWDRTTLAPGQVWTITARETWSAAEMIVVTAPPEQSAWSGQSVTYGFQVGNYQSSNDTIRVSLSGYAWPSTLLGTGTFSLAAGAITTLQVQVNVPAGAASGATDRVTLTAASLSRPAVTGAASAVTTALGPPPPTVGEVQCLLSPPEAVAAGARWRLTSGGNTNWQVSGAVVTNVTPGARALTFRDVSGWIRPADLSVQVVAGQRVVTQAVYTAVATNVQQDVTAWLLHPLFESWTLNRQTGTLFGRLRLRNVAARGLRGPVWLAMPLSSQIRFMHPSGTMPDGRPYVDLTAAFNAGLADGQLDPGETVVIPDIEVYTYNRAAPPDSVFSVWAVPVGGSPP